MLICRTIFAGVEKKIPNFYFYERKGILSLTTHNIFHILLFKICLLSYFYELKKIFYNYVIYIPRARTTVTKMMILVLSSFGIKTGLKM